MDKKLIVISAVNLVEAGTLAILRACLQYLSTIAASNEYRVVAIVYKQEVADFPHIEYIETQWPKKNWINRLWFEYVSMNKISKKLKPVYLWFSLHDTSPNVRAQRRAVYCHNSFFAYQWSVRDFIFAPKIVAFALFTKFIYRVNIYKNYYIVVQQNWFRVAFREMFSLDHSKIIVARPESKLFTPLTEDEKSNEIKNKFTFIFAGSANIHKNFEVICQAAHLLEQELDYTEFKIKMTISGTENKYTKWLKKRWGYLKTLDFIGFVDSKSLQIKYNQADCLIFPSKVESWGLPISEFAAFDKPMLIADLPYAHETAQGSNKTAFFNPNNPKELASLMKMLIQGDASFLSQVPITKLENPYANSWKDLFNTLLN